MVTVRVEKESDSERECQSLDRDSVLVMGRMSWSGGGYIEVAASIDSEWRSCGRVPNTIQTR